MPAEVTLKMREPGAVVVTFLLSLSYSLSLSRSLQRSQGPVVPIKQGEEPAAPLPRVRVFTRRARESERSEENRY